MTYILETSNLELIINEAKCGVDNVILHRQAANLTSINTGNGELKTETKSIESEHLNEFDTERNFI